MKTIKVIDRQPIEATYIEIILFDDLKEYIKYYLDKKCQDKIVRTGFNEWIKKEINNKIYFHHKYESNICLLEKEYKKLLDMCSKTYSIHAQSFNSCSCSYTGDFKDINILLDYVCNDWDFIKEKEKQLDREIENQKRTLVELQNEKDALKNNDVLKNKIRTEYRFIYKKEVDSNE